MYATVRMKGVTLATASGSTESKLFSGSCMPVWQRLLLLFEPPNIGIIIVRRTTVKQRETKMVIQKSLLVSW